jgi:FKBP-type peptidyl-prolyl cis-trans isomerase FkpA
VTLQYLRCGAAALASAGLLTTCLAGCGSSSTSPSNVVPFGQLDVRLGTGTDAVAGKSLTVNYTGWLYDASKTDAKGIQFETSVGATPFTFTLGANQVIQGWERGIPGMKIGGVRRLVIPSSLAYGASRNGPIPPYASLVFEIELLDVQ